MLKASRGWMGLNAVDGMMVTLDGEAADMVKGVPEEYV
jgi:hypothetical protein